MCVCVCTRATCCELRSCDPNIPAKTACLWGETGAEGKSSRGRGTGEAGKAWLRPKQQAPAGLEKVGMEGGGHSFIPTGRQTRLI